VKKNFWKLVLAQECQMKKLSGLGASYWIGIALGALLIVVSGCHSSLHRCIKAAADLAEARAIDADSVLKDVNQYFEANSCEDGAQVQTQASYTSAAGIFLQIQAQNTASLAQAQHQASFEPNPELARQAHDLVRQLADQLTPEQKKEWERCCLCLDKPESEDCKTPCSMQQVQCPVAVPPRHDHIP
jgi:hypothetical protein